MAFQPPARQQGFQRPLAQPLSSLRDETSLDDLPAASALPVQVQPADASHTWVLFSPHQDAASSSALSSVLSTQSGSQPTPGRSRRSDPGSAVASYAQSTGPATLGHPLSLGSVGSASPALAPTLTATSTSHPTHPLSSLLTVSERDEHENDAVADAEEEAALDSLDSQLADFRGYNQIPDEHDLTSPAAVSLPTHDGLGTFWRGGVAAAATAGATATASGAAVTADASLQERLYAFEQFNPRRVNKRRRESLDLAQLQADPDMTEEMERTRRIEAWRWEHSRVLLQEIRKETRRRRGSELSSRRGREDGPADGATSMPATTTTATPTTTTPTDDWHEQEDDDLLMFGSYAGSEIMAEAEGHEGLWSRITRKFMLEFMGIDDHVLAILLGEELPEEAEPEKTFSETPDTLATSAVAASFVRPKASSTDSLLQAYAQTTGLLEDDGPAEAAGGAAGADSSWRLRMLERIAKELGHLVHRHLTAHPGAFSTYQRVQQMPLPYAGLPVIPESEAHEGSHVTASSRTAPTATTDAALPPFQPTILQAAAQVGEEQELPAPGQTPGQTPGQAPLHTFTQDEWEQDLDIKLVFRYLRSRFLPESHAHPAAHEAEPHETNSMSTTSTTFNMQDAAAKAARVRQHHPLVGRSAATTAAASRRATGLSTANAKGLRAHHGSCASQSTRRSARRSSVSSSRHYWDIGGSIGTGSVIASAGPMGSWGEV